MYSAKEKRLRDEFKSILHDLGKDQGLLENSTERSRMYKRLEDLYYQEDGKSFRHFYSDIFSILTQMQQGDIQGDFNILGQNLDVIKKGYKAQNKDSRGNIIDISDSINKLYDHVSLDIARINYSDKADRELLKKDSINEINKKLSMIEKRASDIEEKSDIFENKLEKSQKEYIAILGIFASIVITFVGGITFSSSVLQSMSSVSIYRVVLISLVIGLVLINVFYCLFAYINALVKAQKNLKIAPLWIANIILLALMLCVVMLWRFGVVEKRNTAIQSSVVETMLPTTEDNVSSELKTQTN